MNALRHVSRCITCGGYGPLHADDCSRRNLTSEDWPSELLNLQRAQVQLLRLVLAELKQLRAERGPG